jgi:hypothetical protein
MLGDKGWSIRRGALDTFSAFAQESQDREKWRSQPDTQAFAANVQKLIAAKDMIEKVSSRLEDPNINIQEQALEGIVTLTKNGKSPHYPESL